MSHPESLLAEGGAHHTLQDAEPAGHPIPPRSRSGCLGAAVDRFLRLSLLAMKRSKTAQTCRHFIVEIPGGCRFV